MIELLLYLLLALGVSFICSILEAVLLSTRIGFIATKLGTKGGEVLHDVKTNLDASISSILTLNTVAHTMGAAGVGASALSVFGPGWETPVAIILTVLILYFSEIVPKTLGALYWKNLAIPSAYVIKFLIKSMFPLVWISTKITKFLNRGGTKDKVSREEVLAVTEISEKSGAINEQEGDYIENVLRFKNKKVKDALTPRSVVFSLAGNTCLKDIKQNQSAIEYIKKYSRIPIVTEQLDDAVNYVFSRDILEAMMHEEKKDTTINAFSRAVIRISEEIPVSKAFNLFLQKKEHLFLTVDSHGQISGIITMEDAIETMLGIEIVDEVDDVEDLRKHARDINTQNTPKIIS